MKPPDGGSRDSVEWYQALDTITGPDTLDELQDCLDALWADHPGIAEDVRTNCTVAAFEICSNIVEHSAHGRPVHLRMELRLTPDRIDIDFTDDADPADIDLDRVAFPDDLADRGRGLAITKDLLDCLSYRRESGRNHWTLSQRRVI